MGMTRAEKVACLKQAQECLFTMPKAFQQGDYLGWEQYRQLLVKSLQALSRQSQEECARSEDVQKSDAWIDYIHPLQQLSFAASSNGKANVLIAVDIAWALGELEEISLGPNPLKPHTHQIEPGR